MINKAEPKGTAWLYTAICSSIFDIRSRRCHHSIIQFSRVPRTDSSIRQLLPSQTGSGQISWQVRHPLYWLTNQVTQRVTTWSVMWSTRRNHVISLNRDRVDEPDQSINWYQITFLRAFLFFRPGKIICRPFYAFSNMRAETNNIFNFKDCWANAYIYFFGPCLVFHPDQSNSGSACHIMRLAYHRRHLFFI